VVADCCSVNCEDVEACLRRCRSSSCDGFEVPFKFDGLSGFVGEKATKEKGGIDDAFNFNVVSPSVNSSVVLFSTDAYSVSFDCVERDGEIFSAFILDVKPADEARAFLLAGLGEDDRPDLPPGCDTNSFNEIAAGEGFQCVMTDTFNDRLPSDSTDVVTNALEEILFRFSDGSQIVAGETFGSGLLTGAGGNEQLKNDFGIPSSCAATGTMFLKAPKGAGFRFGGSSEEKVDEKDEGGRGMFTLPEAFKFGDRLSISEIGWGSVFGKEANPVKGKGKESTGIQSFFVRSPEINSTVPVVTSETADIEFSCLESDGEILGVLSLRVKPNQEEALGLVQVINGGPPFDPPGLTLCKDLGDLLTVSPGADLTCVIDFQVVPDDLSTVKTDNLQAGFVFQFSNGLRIWNVPETTISIALTGLEGNSDLSSFFGASSSCAAFGPMYVAVPKDSSLQVITSPLPTDESTKRDMKETQKEEKTVIDGPFKLDGLADSLKLDFDLSGLSGSKLGGKSAKDIGKSAKDVENFNYFVASPSLNTTTNIFSTDFVSYDFACVPDLFPGDEPREVFGVYFLTVKAAEEDIAFLVFGDEADSIQNIFGYAGCQPDSDSGLVVVPAGTGLTCFVLEEGRKDSDEDPDLNSADEVLVQFSNGLQIISGGEDSSAIVLTSTDGNADLERFFGIPSACSSYGYVNVRVPKGVKVATLGGSESFPLGPIAL